MADLHLHIDTLDRSFSKWVTVGELGASGCAGLVSDCNSGKWTFRKFRTFTNTEIPEYFKRKFQNFRYTVIPKVM